MKEIFYSKNMASLVLKKQFLEENDIPCRIFLEGVDVTDMPSHPVFGLSYHLEQEAALAVDDEDEQIAWDLLHNIENPVEAEDEFDEWMIKQPGSFGFTSLKGFFFVFYAVFSIIWLYYAILFVSALWTTGAANPASPEESSFIPVGFFMILGWIFSFFWLFIHRRHD